MRVGWAALTVTALTLTACTSPADPSPSPNSPTHTSAPTSDASPTPAASPSDEDPTSTSEPASPTSPAEPRSIRINTSGDLLWNEALWEAARTGEHSFDFVPQLESLRPALDEADLAICHQEVPVTSPGGRLTQYPTFRAPQETISAVAEVGFDLCTTASNHTMDDGWDGLVRTLDVLAEHGLGATGSWATEADATSPDIFTTDNGVKVGIVSQTYGLNGIPHAPGKEWSVDFLDPYQAIEDAKAARAAGADVVLFHMHAGDEYTHLPDANQQYMVNVIARSGEVDAVIGQHPHWTQPVDLVQGMWVVYSTGNLMASMPNAGPEVHDGALVELTFTEQPDGSFAVDDVTWAPTLITTAQDDPTGIPRVLLIPDELDDADPHLRQRMLDSAARTESVLTSRVGEQMRQRGAEPVTP